MSFVFSSMKTVGIIKTSSILRCINGKDTKKVRVHSFVYAGLINTPKRSTYRNGEIYGRKIIIGASRTPTILSGIIGCALGLGREIPLRTYN